MKTHTQDFKDKIKEMGRQLDSIITYTQDNEEIELGNEELNSITPHYEGTLLKSMMKEIDIDSNVDIPLETEINYQLGLKTGDNYEYLDFGNYIVFSSEKQEDTRSYRIKAYDKMLYSMKKYNRLTEYTLTEDTTYQEAKKYYKLINGEYTLFTNYNVGDTIPSNTIYENVDVSFPLTIREYITKICEQIGLTFKNASDEFVNYDKTLANDPYIDENGSPLDYTYRDVFDELSSVTASCICLDENDEVEIRYETITDTNDFEIEGSTSQETTTGKNLLPNLGETKTQNGITFTKNEDGSVLVNGTATGEASYGLISRAYQSFSAGTYILNGCPSGGSSSSYYLYISPSITSSRLDTGNGTTFTLQANETNIVTITIKSGTTCNNLLFKPMLSTTGGEYEPYTNGPAPNPDYPMPIINKTGIIEEEINGELRKINLKDIELCGIGDYKDKIFRTSGKNLCKVNITQTITQNGITFEPVENGGIKVSGTATNLSVLRISTQIELKGGTTYYINGGYSLEVSVDIRDSRNTKYGTSSEGSNSEGILTPSSTMANMQVSIRVANGTSISNAIIIYPMLSLTSGNGFEPYGSNDEWYKCSKIGKKIFDGSNDENWVLWNIDNTNTQRFYISFVDGLRGTFNVSQSYNNRFTYDSGNGDFEHFRGSSSTISGIVVPDLVIFINRNRLSGSLRPYLENNNLVVYYKLANPTYEPITDQEVINSLNDTGLDEIDEEYLKDVNVNFGEKFGPINSLVLSRSADSDSIARTDEASVELNGLCDIKISDNQILNGNDRDTYIDDIFDKIKGTEYYINDFSSTGICYYDFLDKYNVEIGDNTYSCLMLNDEINVTQGLEEQIHADRIEESGIDYTKVSKTDRAINQTYLIVDKQSQEINAVVGDVTSLQNLVNTQGEQIDLLGTQITQTMDKVEISVSSLATIQDTLANGVNLVRTTSVLINNDGLSVATDSSKISTTMSNNSFTINGQQGEIAKFGYDEELETSVSRVDNLSVTKYFISGYHRTEGVEIDGEYRTCDFYIGG